MIAFIRSQQCLIVLGVASALVYAGYFLVSFPALRFYAGPYMDMGQITGHSALGLLTYVAAFTVLFALFGLAWREVHRVQNRSALWLVLGFGALFALIMIFVYPVTALDVLAYIAYNLVAVVYHHNPIVTPPAVISDPMMSLADGYSGQGAPYGPFEISIAAIPTLLVGRNLLANLLLLKLMFSACTLACSYIVYRILERVEPRYALSGALLVAWNPFLLFENSANGHNDILMTLFVLLALLAMSREHLTLGSVILMASILVKYSSVLVLPLFVVYGVSRHPTWLERWRYAATTGTVVLAFTVLAYVPFWHGPDTFAPLLAQNGRHLYSFSSTLHDVFPNRVSLDQGAWLGRALFVPVYLYLLRLATQDMVHLLQACFLAVFCFFLLGSTNFLYWYAVLPVVLACTVPGCLDRLCAVVMAYAVEIVAVSLNIFVWVWVGVSADTFRRIDAVTYYAVFIVPTLILLGFRRAR